MASATQPATLTKDVDSFNVQAGATVTYTVTYTTNAPVNQTVTFNDVLPAGVTFLASSYANVGTPQNPSFQVPLNLTAGQSFSFTYTAQVNANAPTYALLQNQISATIGGQPLTANDLGIIVTTNTLPTGISKVNSLLGNPPTVQVGDYVTYTIRVPFNGTFLDASNPHLGNICFSDTLPQGFSLNPTLYYQFPNAPILFFGLDNPVNVIGTELTYQSIDQSQVAIDGQTITISNIPLEFYITGGIFFLTYRVYVTATTPPCTFLQNNATISDCIDTPINLMDPNPPLIPCLSSGDTLTKSVTPATVSPGGSLLYTVTLTRSTTTALPNAIYTFTDQLPPGIVYQSSLYTNIGTDTAPIFQIPISNLAPGQSFTFTFNATATNTAPQSKPLQNTLTASDGTTTLTAQDTGVTILPAITKTNSLIGNPPTVKAGDIFTYTINLPSLAATTITDLLPQGLTYVQNSAQYQALNDSGNVLLTGTPQVTLNGQNPLFYIDASNLSVIPSSLTLTYQVQVASNAPQNTSLQNTANLVNPDGTTQSASDPNPPTVLPPTLSPTDTLSKSANPSTAQVGDTITYTVTLTKGGSS